MASFLQHEDTLLIEQVRNNPTLYNTELADYKDGALKEHIWGQVAAMLNKTNADCKRRWKYLRDSYNRCKRKNKSRTGLAALKTTKWCYFETLQFLDKDSTDAQENNGTLNIKTDDSHDEDSQPADENDTNFEFCMVNDEDSTAGKCEESNSADTDLEPSRAGRKRKRETEDSHDYNQPLVNYTKDKRNSSKIKANAPPGDEIDSFCSYIGDILKKLDPTLRVEAKTKIFNLMAQYEIRNLNFD